MINDLNSYQTAINTFKLKYGWLPGDIPNASTVLTTTHNGNGNYVMDNSEGLYAWEHLALSGMISGSYPGTGNKSSPIIGIDIPRSKILNSGYDLQQFGMYGYNLYGNSSIFL